MTKQQVESRGSTETVDLVDESILSQAQKMLGTASPRDTVNEALREVVRQRLARDYVDFMRSQPLPIDGDDGRNSAWR